MIYSYNIHILSCCDITFTFSMPCKTVRFVLYRNKEERGSLKFKDLQTEIEVFLISVYFRFNHESIYHSLQQLRKTLVLSDEMFVVSIRSGGIRHDPRIHPNKDIRSLWLQYTVRTIWRTAPCKGYLYNLIMYFYCFTKNNTIQIIQ